MPRIDTHLDVRGDEFRKNREHMQELVADLERRLERVRAGGGDAQVERHRARGKLVARERIERPGDRGAAFLEFSALAGEGLYDDEAPGAGIVTGIGPVAGLPCVIVANDATVKGGTYYPLTVKKTQRAGLPRSHRIATEAPGRAGVPRGDPRASSLSGRLRRCFPAAPVRGVP